MNRSVCSTAAWLCCLAGTLPGAALQALASPDRLAQHAQADVERQTAINDGLDAMSQVAGDIGGGRTVKGAPYCADAVHESVQWLPDGSGGVGNRIVRQQTSRLCRDGEGRTRQEIERGGRKLVYLRDPVSRENWVLDTERKTARRLGTTALSTHHEGVDAGAMRDFAERMREWARQMADRARGAAENGGWPVMPTPPTPPVPPVPATPTTPAVPGVAPAAASPAPVLISRSGDGAPQTEVRVIRLPAGSQPAGDWAVPPPPVQWRAQHLAPRGAGAVTPLPAREIEGQRAHGERTTWTIEAGRVGNEKPIEITREVWTSPELMLTLSSRDFDPRSGEVSYRLKALKRGEPDATLMRVPADYSKPGRPGTKTPAATG
jgi:hypothetical protein